MAFSVEKSGIVIETVKPAEDGSHDVVVRLYESLGTATRCVFCTSLGCAEVVLTGMLEVPVETLDCEDGRVTLDFRPFEIKTVRLVAKGGAA